MKYKKNNILKNWKIRIGNYQLSSINYQLLSLMAIMLFICSCADSPPVDYQPQNYVEAYLIVDKPITGVKLMITQPVNDSFSLAGSIIRDADVYIKYNGNTLKLKIAPTGKDGYYYPDSTVLVLPETIYNLEIHLNDLKHTVITAIDTTPARISWTNEPPDTLYFPMDSINFSNGTDRKMIWTATKNLYPFFLKTECLDTMEYGKYINGDTTEKNRRCFRPHYNMSSPNYTERTTWVSFLFNHETKILWLQQFKWFGLHEITIQAPDYNYSLWMIQYTRQSEYNPLLGNIKNGIGTFSSASQITKKVFLMKNIP